MRITLTDAGKRFNRDWIFRHLHYEFTEGHSYAITGNNGSGKSTLLQAIAGAIGISEGRARYERAGQAVPENVRGGALQEVPAGLQEIPPEEVFKYISLAAPYLDLVEEMTLTEFLQFHQAFKPFQPTLTIPEMISLITLEAAAHKQIRYYSSGMKQRVKLAQAIFSDTSVLLLDEPCTNLDADGIALYQRLVNEYCGGKLVIVSSNDRQEYEFCDKTLSIMDYK